MATNYPEEQKNDLVISPGWQAYVQDMSKGFVKPYVGPTVYTKTGQDQAVRYDENTKSFMRCNLQDALFKIPEAAEGDYLILENPAERADQVPPEGPSTITPKLSTGRRVNIPGPCLVPLWPGQTARTVKGHQLRFNEYLLMRVYNPDEATANWSKAVVKKASKEDTAVTEAAEKLNLATGKLFIIKGTEVSFYIPPTGVEVVPDEKGNYVRNALTLELMEWCILADESGVKRYPRGEQVVFPEPTEDFVKDKQGKIKFRAIELNAIQGLNLKAIADYKGEYGEAKKGEELFITGKTVPIYFPCAELQIIAYGSQEKYYAVAIPAGEGRYVMDRLAGAIRIERAENGEMFLPDPRKEVIVRRILTPRECQLWYPNNPEALAHNQGLASLSESLLESGKPSFVFDSAVRQYRTRNLSESEKQVAETLGVGDYVPHGNEGFQRGTRFTPPRSITIDTKYDGVPAIRVWTGYAVMVVSKRGNRKVVDGGKTVLLEYDEILETVKTFDEKSQDTVYLRVKNNRVEFAVEVKVERTPVVVKLAVMVDFDGQPERWFEVQEPRQLLIDRITGLLSDGLSKLEFKDLYFSASEKVKAAVLGESESLSFVENGMVVKAVETLDIQVKDGKVNQALVDAQITAATSSIKLFQLDKTLEVEKRTAVVEDERQKLKMAAFNGELALRQVMEKIEDLKNTSRLARELSIEEQEIKLRDSRIETEKKATEYATRAVVERVQAAQNGFSEALLVLSNNEAMAKIAEAMSVQNLLGGKNLVEAMGNLFSADTALGKAAARLLNGSAK